MSVVKYTVEQVNNCSYDKWYPSFEKCAIKSEIIPLPTDFVQYLLEDTIQLNEETETSLFDSYSIYEEKLQSILKAFNNKIFVKLNWSSPQDAQWILPTGLKCTCVEDILMLLKASDFITHDLTEPYKGCVDYSDTTNSSCSSNKMEEKVDGYVLVARKWCNFYDSMHFRCFVVEDTLICICQRKCDRYYDFLVDKQDHLCDLIFFFFSEQIQNKFFDQNFVFDVYVDKQDRVYLIDFNVFGDVTDSLLFSWDELEDRRIEISNNSHFKDSDDGVKCLDDRIDFRVVESKNMIVSSTLSDYRAPTDLMEHLSIEGGFQDFLNKVANDQKSNSCSDDESNDELEGKEA